MSEKIYHTADRMEYELLKENALKMRANPTPAEAVMWQQLRMNQLDVPFRRQHIIGQYIADFVCLQKQLVIEIDGGHHNHEEQQMADEIRTQNLEQYGFRVIRFTNEQVLFDTDKVVETIRQNLQ